MEDAAAIQAFSDNARHILAGQLRRDFPYMDHAAVDRTVEQAMSKITNGLHRASQNVPDGDE
ncbi:hypothetical protein PRZ48_010938 [Zasmidium cellare]|uniref:Uncharacterized protein n=1 Tax=Zasmidium cellare TaxID=395010 RepID=A0ABR0EAK9_ZASCE|nr:hypothetical protein PRZ48_010938 [Zasmidium cellare]